MDGWIDVPKIGLVRASAIVRVGEVGGDSSCERYTIYLLGHNDFEVHERDMPRESFISLMLWEDKRENLQKK